MVNFNPPPHPVPHFPPPPVPVATVEATEQTRNAFVQHFPTSVGAFATATPAANNNKGRPVPMLNCEPVGQSLGGIAFANRKNDCLSFQHWVNGERVSSSELVQLAGGALVPTSAPLGLLVPFNSATTTSTTAIATPGSGIPAAVKIASQEHSPVELSFTHPATHPNPHSINPHPYDPVFYHVPANLEVNHDAVEAILHFPHAEHVLVAEADYGLDALWHLDDETAQLQAINRIRIEGWRESVSRAIAQQIAENGRGDGGAEDVVDDRECFFDAGGKLHEPDWPFEEWNLRGDYRCASEDYTRRKAKKAFDNALDARLPSLLPRLSSSRKNFSLSQGPKVTPIVGAVNGTIPSRGGAVELAVESALRTSVGPLFGVAPRVKTYNPALTFPIKRKSDNAGGVFNHGPAHSRAANDEDKHARKDIQTNDRCEPKAPLLAQVEAELHDRDHVSARSQAQARGPRVQTPKPYKPQLGQAIPHPAPAFARALDIQTEVPRLQPPVRLQLQPRTFFIRKIPAFPEPIITNSVPLFELVHITNMKPGTTVPPGYIDPNVQKGEGVEYPHGEDTMDDRVPWPLPRRQLCTRSHGTTGKEVTQSVHKALSELLMIISAQSPDNELQKGKYPAMARNRRCKWKPSAGSEPRPRGVDVGDQVASMDINSESDSIASGTR